MAAKTQKTAKPGPAVTRQTRRETNFRRRQVRIAAREHVVEDFVAHTFWFPRRRWNSTEDANLRVRQPFEQRRQAALAAPGIAGQVGDRMRDLASRRCDEIAENVRSDAALAPS